MLTKHSPRYVTLDPPGRILAPCAEPRGRAPGALGVSPQYLKGFPWRPHRGIEAIT
jgi:hypothetical protein